MPDRQDSRFMIEAQIIAHLEDEEHAGRVIICHLRGFRRRTLPINGISNLEIQFCQEGDYIHTWTQSDHRLSSYEQGIIARQNNEPIGTLIWSTYDAHQGPQSWLKERYVYLHSAWIHPRHRGRGIIAALAQALRERHPIEVVHGVGPGATLVSAFLHQPRR